MNNEKNSLSIKASPYFPRLLVLGITGLFIGALGAYASLSVTFPIDDINITASAEPAFLMPNPFVGIQLEGRAAYVLDTLTGEELFALKAEAQLPLASITKLMTALLAAETLSAEDTIHIGAEALNQEGNSGFTVGEAFSMEDLLAFTLIESSNDGAYALAQASQRGDTSFIALMNERARELGLVQTYFLNATGLDTNSYISGGYGSAHDVAKLVAHILAHQPQVAEVTRLASIEVISKANILHHATNTNVSLGLIPGLIASKTGFTDLAGGNLTIAFDAGLNHPVVVVILGSTEDGRFRDIEKLVQASIGVTRMSGLSNEERIVQ